MAGVQYIVRGLTLLMHWRKEHKYRLVAAEHKPELCFSLLGWRDG
ncbi:hypothetical protein NSU_3565 [Novosphingobium pentaromativorans US6-1]|uniref:Uncharacterized protein n=1 Tax=Novosphingobium pentaromativorans US6-1 TaxID=1088721 RepID=G6EGU4_9SPHN|nr:hypothetical protein NSU_3565 [Novosphingobium pentaromativorans US6-1]